MRVVNTQALKFARKRKGFTQSNLAALCKCTRTTIGRLEAGTLTQISEDLAREIARWIDRDMEEIFERHEASRTRRPATRHVVKCGSCCAKPKQAA